VSAPDDAPRRGRRGWRLWVRRLLPWAVTAAVVGYILTKYSLSKIIDEMGRGDALPMIPLAAAAVIVLVLVSYLDTLVIRGVLGRPRYRDVVRAKGAMSMLHTLGYGFGHGGYAVWIARVTGASIGETAGVALYISGADLCALSTVAAAMVFLGGAEVSPALAIAPPIIAGVLLLLAMIGPLRLLGEVPSVFRPWSALSRGRQLATIAGRVGNIWLMVSIAWAASALFGLAIPYWVMAAYMPLIILVGSLPINVAGFGAVQGAWLMLEPWAPGEQILAFQFLWSLMIGAGMFLRGVPFIRRVVREIDEGTRLPGDGRTRRS